MKELSVNAIMYQLENNYHIYRMDNRKVSALFVNIFSKVKRVPKVKRITIPDNLVPDLNTTRIICLKDKTVLFIIKNIVCSLITISASCCSVHCLELQLHVGQSVLYT